MIGSWNLRTSRRKTSRMLCCVKPVKNYSIRNMRIEDSQTERIKTILPVEMIKLSSFSHSIRESRIFLWLCASSPLFAKSIKSNTRTELFLQLVAILFPSFLDHEIDWIPLQCTAFAARSEEIKLSMNELE